MKGFLKAVVVLVVVGASISIVAQRQQMYSTPGLIWPGWIFISFPGVPLEPAPSILLNEYDPSGDGSGLNNRLTRWNPADQMSIIFSQANPSAFGNCEIGEGYHLYVNAGEPVEINYSAYPYNFGTDFFISLPKSGKTEIGHPFNFAVAWANVMATDGTKTVTLKEAETLGWLDTVAVYFDSFAQENKALGLPEDNPDKTSLEPWRAYQVTTFKDDLALIIPGR